MSGTVEPAGHTWSSLARSWSDRWGRDAGRRGPRLRGPVTINDLTGRDRWRWALVDVAAVLTLLALATVALWPVYETGWLWVAASGGALLGTTVGVVAAWHRWAAWLTVVVVALGHLLLGSFLAMPHQATWGVLPNARTLSGLVRGTVQVWKRVLTLDAPIGLTDNRMGLTLLTMILAAMVCTPEALRSGRTGLA